MVGQPAAPADDQHGLREELDDRHRHVDEGPWGEDEQELPPEGRGIARLDRVVPSRLKKFSRNRTPTSP